MCHGDGGVDTLVRACHGDGGFDTDTPLWFAYHKGGIPMSKTTSIYARVEPEIKEQAEIVLNKLGIPMSNVINIFLRQIILQNGLPFEV